MTPDPIPFHPRLLGLLPKQESGGGNPMPNRKAFETNRSILEQDFRSFRGRRMKLQRKIQPAFARLLMQVQYGLQLGRAVDVQGPGPPQQIERGHQTGKPQIMVAMQVGNADVVKPHHADSLVPQCNLRPLSAIEEELLFVDVEVLRSRIPSRQRKGRTTTEDVDFEAQARQRWIRTRRTSMPSPRWMRR